MKCHWRHHSEDTVQPLIINLYFTLKRMFLLMQCVTSYTVEDMFTYGQEQKLGFPGLHTKAPWGLYWCDTVGGGGGGTRHTQNSLCTLTLHSHPRRGGHWKSKFLTVPSQGPEEILAGFYEVAPCLGPQPETSSCSVPGQGLKVRAKCGMGF